jgi:hypothetical protein
MTGRRIGKILAGGVGKAVFNFPTKKERLSIKNDAQLSLSNRFVNMANLKSSRSTIPTKHPVEIPGRPNKALA